MAGASIEYDVAVPMRDGCVLRADVYRPTGPGPWPVIVARTPYGRTPSVEIAHLDPWAAVRHGLIAVVQDTRGRHGSEGDGPWRPLDGEDLDGADTIEWAARLPGSNGHVGTWGFSYLGNVQVQAASQRPPSLAAITPGLTWHSPDDGLVARGGARELGLGVWWGLFTGFDALVRTHADDEREMAARMSRLVHDYDNLATDGYWELPLAVEPVLSRHDAPSIFQARTRQAAALDSRLDRVDVPVLNIGGWYDVFLQGTIDNHVSAGRHTTSRLVIGPWCHVNYSSVQGDLDFGISSDGSAEGSPAWLPGLAFDWLKRHASSADDEWSTEAPVRIFVMGANEWRDEEVWPPAGLVPTRFVLDAGGVLTLGRPAKEGTASYSYDPLEPVPTCGGSTLLPGLTAGAVDQSRIESREDVLVFTTAELTDDVEVTGRVSATLKVSSDAQTTDWVVRLCDVHPDGRSFNVTDGVARVTMESGVPQQVEVDLWSTSMVFKTGHRIRVQVTSSCFPRWDRNLNTRDGERTGEMRVARQTVHTGGIDGSHITLPINSR
jgi:putative CocE/NonD family hydrolase